MSANTGSGIDCGSGDGRTWRKHTASGTCAGAELAQRARAREQLPQRDAKRKDVDRRGQLTLARHLLRGAEYWSGADVGGQVRVHLQEARRAESRRA
jgi:hypothetical protein